MVASLTGRGELGVRSGMWLGPADGSSEASFSACFPSSFDFSFSPSSLPSPSFSSASSPSLSSASLSSSFFFTDFFLVRTPLLHLLFLLLDFPDPFLLSALVGFPPSPPVLSSFSQSLQNQSPS